MDRLAEYLMESDRRKTEWEMERERRQEERAAEAERRLVEQERRHIDGMNRMGAMMALMAAGKASGKGRALFTGGVEGAALEDATEAWESATANLREAPTNFADKMPPISMGPKNMPKTSSLGLAVSTFSRAARPCESRTTLALADGSSYRSVRSGDSATRSP